ncbi:hypothetical protein HKX48_001629 [Thoreauomyces humboldtii]|nr:hypothetical protein HKX48_001629 [Thoreauomyces humboldtii]
MAKAKASKTGKGKKSAAVVQAPPAADQPTAMDTDESNESEASEWEDVVPEGTSIFDDEPSLEDDGDMDGEEEVDEDDFEEGDEELADGEANEDEEAPAAKRQRTAEEEEKQRQSRAEQKAQQIERRDAKPNAQLIQEAKMIWEKLRQKKISAKERQVEMEALMKLIRGKVKDVIFKHDASRVVQCALKYGNQKQRDEIADELKGHYADLSKGTYGRFIISKILQYCSPEFRALVLKDFNGKIRKIIKHKEAALILEEAYSQSNGKQKAQLLEEFYGPEFALYKSAGGSTVEQLIAENPAKKVIILKHLRMVLDSILEKGFTVIGHLTIVHRALLEYMTYAEEKQVTDIVELLKEHLADILHTREGAQVAQLCILHAGPKDRKTIVKTFKTYVRKIAKEQYGHTVLMTVFECVDDTVLVEKAIIGELTTDGLVPGEFFSDLLRDRFASRVILFLLAGRNRFLQPAFVINELERLDAVRARTSKKDDSLKKAQLLKAISPLLLKACAAKTPELIRDSNSGQVVSAALFHAEGDKKALIAALAQCAEGTPDKASEATPSEKKPFNAVTNLKADATKLRQEREGLDMAEHAMINRSATAVLKDVVAPRHKGAKKSAEDVAASAPHPVSLEFSTALANVIAPNVAFWVDRCAEDPTRTSGTAFVLVALAESGSDEAKKVVKKALSGKKVAEISKKVAEKVKEAANATPVVAEGGDKKRKRKGGAAAKKDGDASAERPRTTGIQTFLEAYKALASS